MAANRIVPTLANTPGGISGSAYATDVSDEIAALYAGRFNQVTSVAGTNTITGVCTPPLTASPVHGETFRLTPAASNTGAVTVNIDGTGAIDLRSADNQPLITGDIISGVPIWFWFDSGIGDYRLGERLLSNIASELADDIAAGAIWEELGYTLVTGGPVATVEHVFTADLYSVIKTVGTGISSSANSVTLIVSIRSSTTSLTSASMGASTITNGNTNGFNVDFFIDRNSGNRRSWSLMHGFFNGNQPELPTVGNISNANVVVDRVRWAFSAGNIDAGEIWTYGLRA